MDLTTAQHDLPLQMPDKTNRYWRIDSVRGKGRRQTHNFLCVVASATTAEPVRLASAAGFRGPFHCVEMSFAEYAANLQRAFR